MKNLFLILCLATSSIFSQSKTVQSTSKKQVSVVHSMNVSVNSMKELQEINWNDIKQIFEKNEPEEQIELSFEVDLKASKNKMKSSFKVGGKSKNIDSLIIRMKKGVKVITKLMSQK